MLLPGLKKLRNQLGFDDNGSTIYGFVKSCFFTVNDGKNLKLMRVRTPVVMDEEDQKKIMSWQKKGYACQILFDEDPSRYIEITFPEKYWFFSIAKIKEVIEDIAGYVAQKYPEAKICCSCQECSGDENTPIHIYQLNGEPVPLCEACAKEIRSNQEARNEEKEHQPDNYLQGALGAAVLAIPGILVSLLFYQLGRIAAVSGLVYFFLAMYGYNWAKGKMDKTGILLIAVISLAFSALGTYLGFWIDVANELADLEVYSAMPFMDRMKEAYTLLDDPDLRTSLNADIAMTLLLCGICIVYNTYLNWKSLGKEEIDQIGK